MVSSAFLENVSIGSWAPSCWLKSLEQTVFPSKAPWSCWFSGFDSLEGFLFFGCCFFVFNVDSQSIILKISPFLHHHTRPLRHDIWGCISSSSCVFFPFISFHKCNHLTSNKSKQHSRQWLYTKQAPLGLQPITMSSGIFTFPFSTHFDDIGETQSQLCRPRWSERKTGLMVGRCHGFDWFYEVQIQHWGCTNNEESTVSLS